jgi:AGCS family alanine or glycine:cation symporter
MVQSNSVAHALSSNFDIPGSWTGMVLMFSTVVVIVGGIKSIGRVTGILVPVMIFFYFVSALAILLIHIESIPGVFMLIVESAFSGSAAAGGFLGATVMLTVRMGVARGVFSNESGLGSSPIAAAAAKTRHPVSQALVSMTQTFIDTIVICTLTGFAIVISGLWVSEPLLTGAELTSAAFSKSLPGTLGGDIVATGLVLFAYSTILGWSYYGEKAVEFIVETGAGIRKFVAFLLIVIMLAPLWIILQVESDMVLMFVLLLMSYLFVFAKVRDRLLNPDIASINILYRGAFSVYVLVGTVVQLDLVWAMADVFNGLMAFPNLVGVLGLSGVVVAVTRDYFKNEVD